MVCVRLMARLNNRPLLYSQPSASYQWSWHPKSAHMISMYLSAIRPKSGSVPSSQAAKCRPPPCTEMLAVGKSSKAISGGTLPWNAGRMGIMPRSRYRCKIFFCSAHCAVIQDCVSATFGPGEPSPPAPTPCIDCPRDQESHAGPLVQLAKAEELTPNDAKVLR